MPELRWDSPRSDAARSSVDRVRTAAEKLLEALAVLRESGGLSVARRLGPRSRQQMLDLLWEARDQVDALIFRLENRR